MHVRDNQRIRDLLPKSYRKMHTEGAFHGQTYRRYLGQLERLLHLRTGRILDYGCGPQGGLAEFMPGRVIPYDPYVDAYSKPPWKESWEVFFSADVFEHMLLNDTVALLRRLAKRRTPLIILSIATRPARKTFPNGLNVHLVVRPAWWWAGFLEATLYDTHVLTEAIDELGDEYAFFVLHAPPRQEKA